MPPFQAKQEKEEGKGLSGVLEKLSEPRKRRRALSNGDSIDAGRTG